ncbi:MAG: PLP-dependent aminotransferase family protein, partial [Propionicimonas sp.]|nr:PLP-dependent aminotransferase family protein [Propionicimonas sp.]
TVVGAYDLLRGEGVLVSKQGSGTWVAGAARSGSTRGLQQESLGRAALSAGEQLIDLATASLPAVPALRDALQAISGGFSDSLLGQTGYSAFGLPEARRAVATMFTRDGLPTSPEQILITTGDQQALSLIVGHFLDTGDSVLLEDPTSAGMLDLVRRMPVVARGTRSLSRAGAASLTAAIRKVEPTLVYVMTALGPEGLVPSAEEVRTFARGLQGFGGVLVEDTSSRMLIRSEPPRYLAGLVPEATSVLTVGSMSKLFWGGLRVGWVRGDENVILRLSRAKALADLGTPMLSQLVAAWLLHRLPEIQQERQAEVAARSAQARELVRSVLPEFTMDADAGALSLWLRLPRGASQPFSEVARRHGVAIVAGASLSVTGDSDNYLRVALGVSPDAFSEGIHRIAQAWQEYNGRAERGSLTSAVRVAELVS